MKTKINNDHEFNDDYSYIMIPIIIKRQCHTMIMNLTMITAIIPIIIIMIQSELR